MFPSSLISTTEIDRINVSAEAIQDHIFYLMNLYFTGSFDSTEKKGLLIEISKLVEERGKVSSEYILATEAEALIIGLNAIDPAYIPPGAWNFNTFARIVSSFEGNVKYSDYYKGRLKARINEVLVNAYNSTVAFPSLRATLIEDLRSSNIPDTYWKNLVEGSENEQDRAMIADIQNLLASNFQIVGRVFRWPALKDWLNRAVDRDNLSVHINNRIRSEFGRVLTLFPNQVQRFIQVLREDGVDPSIIKSIEDDYRKYLDGEIRRNILRIDTNYASPFWGNRPLPLVGSYSDIQTEILDRYPFVEESKRNEYDQLLAQRLLSVYNNITAFTSRQEFMDKLGGGSPGVFLGLNLPDTIAGEVRRIHEENRGEEDVSQIRTDINTIPIPATGANNAFNNNPGNPNVLDIHRRIQSISDEQLKEELHNNLINRVIERYNNATPANRDVIMNQADAVPGIPEDILNKLRRRRVDDFFDSFVSPRGVLTTIQNAVMVEMYNRINVLPDNEQLLTRLQGLLEDCYFNIVDANQRGDFVNSLVQAGMDREFISKIPENFESTLTKEKDYLDSLIPIIERHVRPNLVGSISLITYFDTYVLPELRVQAPDIDSDSKASILTYLREQFITEVVRSFRLGDMSTEVEQIERDIEDTVIDQLLNNLGLANLDPFSGSRSVIGGVNFVNANDQIDFGAIYTYIGSKLSGLSIGGMPLGIDTQNAFASMLYKEVLKKIENKMPLVTELRTHRDEITEKEIELNRLREDRNLQRFSFFSKIASIGIPLASLGSYLLGVDAIGSALSNFVAKPSREATHLGIAATGGIPALVGAIWGKVIGEDRRDMADNLRKAEMDLENLRIETEASATKLVTSKESDREERRSFWDKTARKIIYPAVRKGKSSVRSRVEYLRSLSSNQEVSPAATV